MIDIKNLELTEQDFQLLIEGLDVLPSKDVPNEMMFELMTGLISGDNEEAKKKVKLDREERARKSAAAKQQKIEDIKILQGKLLMLKRWLLQQGALKQAYDILDNPTKADI